MLTSCDRRLLGDIIKCRAVAPVVSIDVFGKQVVFGDFKVSYGCSGTNLFIVMKLELHKPRGYV